MDPKLIFYIVIFTLGILVYIIKPKLIFYYYIGAQPLLMPIYYLIFPTSGANRNFFDLYFSLINPLNYVLSIVFLIELLKSKKINVFFLFPVFLLIVFFLFQGLFTNGNLHSIFDNFTSIFYILLPFAVLLRTKKLRPNRKKLLIFFIIIILLQFVFSIYNLFGYKLYNLSDEIFSGFQENAISGTFARYNHMTNYITTLYLFITIDYLKYKYIKTKLYLIITFITAFLVMFSGAKLSVVLFFLIFIMGRYIKNGSVSSLIKLSLLASLFVFLLINTSGINQNDSAKVSGIERNIGGLAFSLKNSGTSNDDSTVSLSLLLLAKDFNNIFWGNGYYYLGEKGYDNMQYIYQADSRLAYTIVEYGIIGMICMIFFYISIFNSTVRFGILEYDKIFVLIIVYYIIFTATEGGLFDNILFSILGIYSLGVTEDYRIINQKRIAFN